MNDRFAAQVRQHLLNTADERPADGQLAAVVARVAATTQRLPLVARLTWMPGRIGPFPALTVRYGLVAAALLVAALVAVLVGGGTATRSTVFEGTWLSIDPLDGSHQTLVIGGGNTPTVHFEDDLATGGACDDDVSKVYTAEGTGEIAGNLLRATFPEGGGCISRRVPMVGFFYRYRSDSDVLLDHDGVTWSRAGRPVVEASADLSLLPTGDPRFSSTIHGISIQYPASWETAPASQPWTEGLIDFGSASADVIFDPARGGGLYVAFASQPYGDLSADEWRARGIEPLCPGGGGGGAYGEWGVGGAEAFLIRCPSTEQAVFILTERRGYLLRLVVDDEEPGLSDTYNWDWLRPMLETVELRPEEAFDGLGPALPSEPVASGALPAEPMASAALPAEPFASEPVATEPVLSEPGKAELPSAEPVASLPLPTPPSEAEALPAEPVATEPPLASSP
ncbi:MAG TPA: hypothetical protein VFP56_04290 [Candidatus Limnocylindrales bacterium]|nr:hypothetical protein [Candidatus Limnocylindrales bacterium]